MSKEIGKIFEQKAVAYLKDKSYSIIKTNYFFKNLEIDIIATFPQNILVFFEIKYRKQLNNNSFGIYETISKKKQKNICKCAEGFLINFPNYQKYYCRFDGIFFYYEEKQLRIKHLENIFSKS